MSGLNVPICVPTTYPTHVNKYFEEGCDLKFKLCVQCINIHALMLKKILWIL